MKVVVVDGIALSSVSATIFVVMPLMLIVITLSVS
jgi:hypothetical protein